MFILLLLAAVTAVSASQNDCSQGPCYPLSRDLLLGRSHLLHASSTCGLTGSEVFCTPYQQIRMKCCPCDSRDPNGPLAHTVQDVLATSGPDRWWQSKKGVNPVTLQFDLNNLFQLDNLVLHFKGPRPQAFVIERSVDNRRTWEPALYFATDCQKAFPGVPTTLPVTLDQTYCHTLTRHPDAYKDERIEFSPLRQYLSVPAPNSQKREVKSGFTSLRLRLTELGEVPHQPGRSLSRFYTLQEMKVMGSCMCHGHANRCLPEEDNNGFNTIQVNPRCDCRHNTAGTNCERCAELYNDLPWRPAEEGNTHTCKRCECNNHAQRCHFDPEVYEASGRTSGGVCESCMHHTTGPKCDRCAPGYQPNPRSQMDQPDACIRCICGSEGTVDGAQCEDSSGSCQCKANVEGLRCDRCKRGHYGLSQSNPLGCSRCSCSPDGSLSDVCDLLTGQCPCRPHFHGRTCDVCSKGYWKPRLSNGCEPCGCEPTGSNSDTCDTVTGQCECRQGFGGRTCSECPDNMYGNPLIGCRPCQCDVEGTLPGVCDKQTGRCLCKSGITGTLCDMCRPGHCDSFPTCERCPSCFFTLDLQRKNISLALEKLSLRPPSVPGGDDDNVELRIQALEAGLKLIRNSVSRPPNTLTPIENALVQLDKLRNDLDKVDNDLPASVGTPDLESELNRLQALLDSLTLTYKAKKNAVENSIDPSSTGAFLTIKNAYDVSTDAAKKVNTSTNIVEEAMDLRKETKDIQSKVQETNTRDLNQMNQTLASQPDLTPTAKQVCGSVRSEPCTPLECEAGALCPPEGTPPCKMGKNCVGALPLSNKADADVNNVKDRLDQLNVKMTDAAEMLQKTQETTNEIRQSAMDLSNKLKKARDQLEEDLNDTRTFVKELKDFLSDPTSNLTQIQEISDWILKAKVPLSPATLKMKLEELKNLAANLPNSTAVLKEAEPQLDTARKLLREAQDARDKALGVKTNVTNLHAGLDSAHEALSDLENKLQESMDTTENLTKTLTQVKDQLGPAEKVLDDVSTLIKPMETQLGELKELLKNGLQKAQDSQENADKAEEDAAAANQDLLTLEKQLNQLKDQGATMPAGEAGLLADRLAKLQDSAGALANTTETMLTSLAGKADSLQALQDEILQKSTKLEGLDAKLKDLLTKLRQKAKDFSGCQG